MGWAALDHRRPWTAEDNAYLEDKLGTVSVKQIAKVLKRSVGAVEGRAEKLRLSRRIREGYNMTDLQAVFGVPYARVKRWMDAGLFGTVHRHQACHVTEAAVTRFLRDHATEYDLRRVDQLWFKGMVFGSLGDIRLGER